MKEKEDSFSKQKRYFFYKKPHFMPQIFSLCTELVHKSSCGSTAKKKRRGSSPIASSSGSNVTTTALKISSTRDSREVVCSSATAKETIKKPSPVLEQGKTSAVVSNVTDDKKVYNLSQNVAIFFIKLIFAFFAVINVAFYL